MKKDHVLRELSAADYITLTATALAVIALWVLWRGQVNLAIAIAFVSIFLDYLDGTIARKYGGSPYGKVLDSLYDVLGFVVFPSLVVITLTDWAWWCLVVVLLYHLAAVIRLARFTAQGYVENKKRYYVGVPVLFSKYALLLSFVAGGVFSVLILAVMIPLMISSRLVKKPHPIFAQLNLLYAAFFALLAIR